MLTVNSLCDQIASWIGHSLGDRLESFCRCAQLAAAICLVYVHSLRLCQSRIGICPIILHDPM